MSSIIIGVDHGNGNIKTKNDVFACGFVKQHVKPAKVFSKDVLKYQGNYFILTDDRFPYKTDKTKDEDYFILTLFAIAKEAERTNTNLYGKDIILSVGLPPAHLEKQAERFKKYFEKNASEGINFEYNDKKFSFYLKKVYVSPQNYSAVIYYEQDLLKKYKTVYCIDIGDGTVDLVTIKNGIPDKQTIVSREIGISVMRDKIINDVVNDFEYTLDGDAIEQVLLGKETVLPEEIKNRIKYETKEWSENIVNQLHPKVPDFRINPTVFSGGGAKLLKPFFEKSGLFGMTKYIEDISANAAGYELIANLQENK